MIIGVLALQGAFREHLELLGPASPWKRDIISICGENLLLKEVRLPEDLTGIDGLIIPGGESTTIGKLAEFYGLIEPIRQFANEKPVWGICAGMIFMSCPSADTEPEQRLSIIDIEVERNAFGRQYDSFEAELDVSFPVLETERATSRAEMIDKQALPFPAVFIRAPKIIRAGSGVLVLATLPDSTPVGAIQNNCIVTAFHPELTTDFRFYRFFLDFIASRKFIDR